VTSTEPLGLQPQSPIPLRTATDAGAGPLLPYVDARRVRVYCRVTAIVAFLLTLLLALVTAWLLRLSLDASWDRATGVILAIVTLRAVARLLLAELRLRTYDIRLTADAIIYEYGRTRWYVPCQHIQLLDIESSLLLRRFALRRCNLHTAGGTVVVSPVPARVASAIERLTHEQRTTHPGHTDDVA
jgi:membrane protein YdbS with pleckstrin-like domain